MTKDQNKKIQPVIPVELIERQILLLRGQKVMLSTHLADLYGVQARALVQAVKRNIERFPDDFMFQLTQDEFKNLKSQFVISSWGGLRRATPYAFTQEGVAMLSSVLNSKRAIHVNIVIMRAFVKLREWMLTHHDLAKKIDDLERKYQRHDVYITEIFTAIRKLLEPPKSKTRPIGFTPNEKRGK